CTFPALGKCPTATIRLQTIPVSPWTVGQWMKRVILKPDRIRTCNESIHCPSPWTVEQWMNVISPIHGISYDELSTVQAWTPDAALGVATSWHWGFTCDPNEVN